LIGHASCDWDWDPLCPSVAVVIAPSDQRQGYGSETLNLMLGYLFGHTPANNANAWMADWNRDALGFAKKHGFQESGRSRREGLWEGAFYDEIVMDLLRSEWPDRAAAQGTGRAVMGEGHGA
jgi:RimJ/RimL family protein N-acetyltransferase